MKYLQSPMLWWGDTLSPTAASVFTDPPFPISIHRNFTLTPSRCYRSKKLRSPKISTAKSNAPLLWNRKWRSGFIILVWTEVINYFFTRFLFCCTLPPHPFLGEILLGQVQEVLGWAKYFCQRPTTITSFQRCRCSADSLRNISPEEHGSKKHLYFSVMYWLKIWGESDTSFWWFYLYFCWFRQLRMFFCCCYFVNMRFNPVCWSSVPRWKDYKLRSEKQ